jgi:hypothetical protein
MSLIVVTCLSLGALTLPVHGADDWKLQFTDDFHRSELNPGGIDLRPPDWNVLGGKWHIEKDMLSASGNALIVLLLRFPGDQRLEFDAVATEDICDLSGILNTSKRGGESNGYFFGFGSNRNAYSQLLIKGQQVKRYDTRITPGKLHHVVCQREGSRLTHIIDGKVVATYDHNKPLTGAGHDAVGFYIYGTGKIDNVKVYTKGPAPSQRFAVRKKHTGSPTAIELENPLFEELFGDTPGPTRFFNYGGRHTAIPGYRTGSGDSQQTAKRFGMRYVLDEILDEAGRYKLIVYGKLSNPIYATRDIATYSNWVRPPKGEGYYYLPDTTLPPVQDGHGWFMDPRYLNHLVNTIEDRAREGEQWGIPMFDELWTWCVIKPVPKDKWYKQVIEADREIREKYGFGKYTMPESHESGDPFDRIAYRRWASDKLTEVWKKTYAAAKAINPKMKIIGPTEGSSGTAADIEAWAPYFDIVGGQCALGPTSAFFDSVRVGAVTKMYVDLTGKPTWIMVHASAHHASRRSPENLREAYSQVFRNGGQGLWVMNLEFFEVELIDAMFAEPAKSRAMLQLTETISKMRLPVQPQPDCAIFWSSDSMLTGLYGQFWGNDNDRILSTYSILGPMLRNAFRFVSDRQIDRNTRDLSDYKVVYIPYATYQRASVVEKIGRYVKAGGTVVCTDTDAFTWKLDGEIHGQQWTNLSGIRKVSKREAVSTFTTVTPNPLALKSPITLTSLEPGWNIEPVNDNVRIIAAYEDGLPAITLHPYGKGKVIFFAADPLRASDYFRIPKPFFPLGKALDKKSLVKPGAPIVQLIEAIQKSEDVQMDRDIWRFKLPDYTKDPYQKQTGLCLTGNYVYDINLPLLEPNNLQTRGAYTYSRPPTGIADNGQVGKPVSFKEGKLTNRLKAYETRQKTGWRNRDFNKVTPEWIVSWTDRAPVSITFDLKSDHLLKRLRFFYSGTMGTLQVSGSSDAKQWEKLAGANEESAGADVKDVVVQLNGKWRYVKLKFNTRTTGDVFELSEVELWSDTDQ